MCMVVSSDNNKAGANKKMILICYVDTSRLRFYEKKFRI